MKHALLFVAVAALSGCTFCQEHRATCAAVAVIAATSIVLSTNGHHGRASDPAQDFPISAPLTPDCAKFPEMCK